jgi:hypothetical protein
MPPILPPLRTAGQASSATRPRVTSAEAGAEEAIKTIITYSVPGIGEILLGSERDMNDHAMRMAEIMFRMITFL